MRFLGNKTSILSEIETLLDNKKLLHQRLVFFDAFCGSGSVSDYFKKYYDIIINDNLNWAVIYSRGRVVAKSCYFKELGFDPFDFFNNNTEVEHSFFYDNYSPAKSNRMYFSEENAARIDYFRNQIESWFQNNKINYDEYCYLLACLIESISDVSNTAGVYGAFLKKWDNRALNPIYFDKVDFTDSLPKSIRSYTDRIEDIIENIDCDILYLDPPYTQNQYGTQYHLLETLVLNDNPEISRITGSRSTTPMRSNWSKDIHSHILFDRVVAKTKAKYILFSYNNDGFMSKDFIESTLKRYGKKDTYICKKIPYKKYQNWKSNNNKKHYEYLFFIEKKPSEEVVYESPLNYIGNKSKIITEIKKYLMPNSKFYDLFGGGFNVGINVNYQETEYVDINSFVSDLINSFMKYDTYEYVVYVRKIIKRFGLEKGNKAAYNTAKEYYNSLPVNKRDPRLLYAIMLYGFQQQIRFNGNHEFNNPVGVRWFNDRVLEKLISFSRQIKENHPKIRTSSYIDIEEEIDSSCFVYMDPPYLLTNGSYNDGKRGFNGWDEEQESALFEFADRLNEKGVPFMLSYVKEHKGKTNEHLCNWLKEHNYQTIELDEILGVSGKPRKEILVINYDFENNSSFYNKS